MLDKVSSQDLPQLVGERRELRLARLQHVTIRGWHKPAVNKYLRNYALPAALPCLLEAIL